MGTDVASNSKARNGLLLMAKVILSPLYGWWEGEKVGLPSIVMKTSNKSSQKSWVIRITKEDLKSLF